MLWESILVGLIATLIGIGSYSLTIAFVEVNLIPALIGIPMISLGIILVLRCFRAVPEEKAVVLTKWGAFYKEKRGGLRIVEVPGVIKIKAVVPLWIESIEIFDGNQEVHFKRGSAYPKITLKVKITNAYKAVFKVDNWREYVKDIARQILNDLLPTHTLDEWSMKVSEKADFLPLLRTINNNAVQDFIEKCRNNAGVEVDSLVMEKWEFSPDVVEQRHKVYISHLEQEIADIKREELIKKEAMYITKVKEVLMNNGWKEDEAKRAAERIFNYIVAGRVGEVKVFLTSSEYAAIIQELKQALNI